MKTTWFQNIPFWRWKIVLLKFHCPSKIRPIPPYLSANIKKQLFISHVSHLSYTTIGTLLTWEGPSSKFLIQYHSKPFQYFHFTKLPKESSPSRSIPSYNKTVSYLKILTFYLKGWLFFDFCRVLVFETVITFRL